MGCHTWYYKPFKVKSINRHVLRKELIEDSLKWTWKSINDNEDKYILDVSLQRFKLTLEEFNILRDTNIKEYQRIIYEIDEKINEEINYYNDKKTKYSDLLKEYISYKDKEKYDVSLYSFNKRLYYEPIFGDNIFRIYGYPARVIKPGINEDTTEYDCVNVRSYKAFKRLIFKSYINSKLPEDQKKIYYGIVNKLPTRGQWKKIRKYCKGNFILSFG